MTNTPPTPTSTSMSTGKAPAPPPAEAAERRDWPAYFDRMRGKPPRDTLLAAIQNTNEPGLAIDLGCGDGRDTQALLDAGWRVWALDGSQDGIRRLKERETCAQAEQNGRLTVTRAGFEDIATGKVRLPPTSLLNASFSLPFCPPQHFQALWASINQAIEPGGRFSGQFFGDRDSWSTIEDRTHLTRPQVIRLFDDWVLESLREEDRPSTEPDMPHKHWHVFHVVSHKRPNPNSAGDRA